MRSLCFIVAVFVTLALPNNVFAQKNSECDIQRSTEWPGKVDVHCDCMQSLIQINQNLDIARLTINQHDCSKKGLQLYWPDLLTHVAPSTFVIEGANVHFGKQDPRPHQTFNSSIINLEFKRCSFGTIPPHAFAGLEALETLRISLSSIDVVQSGVFSKLSQLHLIEITNSTVGKVSERSFADLPSLSDLAFTYSAFEEISSEAVYLPRLYTGDAPRCGNLGRSLSSDTVLTEIMGRQLPSSVNLPEFGTRFFLFKNSIKTLRSLAITSETLGFLIAGGNYFGTIESVAFNMELYNECEISAALFVSNVFQNLNAGALMGLRGPDGSAFQSYIALSNNTFYRVEEKGFMLSRSLVIFTVESNTFHCKCNNFDWVYGSADSPSQGELEKELVLRGTCHDGMNLTSYTPDCSDNGAGLASSLSAVTSLLTLALCVLFV